MATKRVWKLDDIAAHVGSVNCLALGHNTGRVMVTGGEDRKVNMWAIGKPNCILSLSGHTTPVEAVKFNSTENVVIAGSLSGALKIWDLESVKILRTLTGHKSGIRTMDFHPYGEYVASGSLDTNIKLWDMRRRGCIFTYKGHTNCVNYMKFSPDGRWIASGGEDGLVKLWDLSAGKLLSEFRTHSGPVNTVEFHPNEFFLASGSSDRTVKFWDLESMQMVCSTDGDCMPVRSIAFHPDALCLYCGSENQLKVYGWEPAQCFDSLTTGWGRVSDIAIAQKQLVGASFSQSNVTTYIVDIERVQPLGGTPSVSVSRPSTTSRRSFIADRFDIPTVTQPSKLKEEADEPVPVDDIAEDTPSTAELPDPEQYKQVFRPKHHSPPISVKPFPAPVDEGAPSSAGTAVVRSGTADNVTPLRPEPFPVTDLHPTTSVTSTKAQQRPFQPKKPSTTKLRADNLRTDNSDDMARGRRRQSSPINDSSGLHPDRDVPSSGARKTRDDFQVDIHVARPRLSARENDIASDSDVSRQASAEANRRNTTPVVVADDFLQKSKAHSSDDDINSFIHDGHGVLMKVMSSRSSNLQVVKAMWSGGNVKTAIESALHMNDKAITYDVVSVLLCRTTLWNLELCVLLIPALSELTTSQYPNYVRCGVDGLKHILRQFAPVIKSSISAPPSAGIGVDISREERYQRCMMCYKMLMNVRSSVENKLSIPDELAPHIRELRMLMAQLD